MSWDASSSSPKETTPSVKLDLSGAKKVGVPSKEDLIEMLRSGEVVVIDRSTGKFLTNLFGVPLPPVERVLETVIAKGPATK